MINENDKNKLKNLTESEFFDFLIEKHIKIKVREIFKRNKWILSVLILLIVGFGSFVGYKFYDFNKVNKDLTIQFGDLKSKMKVINSEADSLINVINVKIKEVNYEINSVKDFNKSVQRDYELMEKNMLYSLKTMDELFKSIMYQAEGIGLQMKSEREELNKILKKNLVFYDNAEKKSEQLNNLLEKATKIASTRYLFVERGIRHLGDDDYRPSSINLPYDNTNIIAVFHGVNAYDKKLPINNNDILTIKEVKEASIDLITITEGSQKKMSLILREHEAQYIANTRYMIELQYMYLPPNSIFQRVPDFIVLKIFIDDIISESLNQ